MTSEQVMLTLAALLLVGCTSQRPAPVDPLVSPYASPRVWAVMPLRNESGSLQADGTVMADHLARQLENARNIDVLPVNRVLMAMEALQLREVRTPAEAIRLMGVLSADGLVVGTITAFDPYDPPKMGLAIELYESPRVAQTQPAMDVRELTRAATAEQSGIKSIGRASQPVSVVSAFFDAADPVTRGKLQRYGYDRSAINGDDNAWRRYRISMDLFSEFASYVMSWRLLRAETQRLAPPPPATQPAR